MSTTTTTTDAARNAPYTTFSLRMEASMLEVMVPDGEWGMDKVCYVSVTRAGWGGRCETRGGMVSKEEARAIYAKWRRNGATKLPNYRRPEFGSVPAAA